MDGNTLNVLREARQSYWEVMGCDNVVTDEQRREPKAHPCPKVKDSAWAMGGIGFGLAPILFVLSGIASCAGAKSSTVNSLGRGCLVFLIFGVISMIMNSITKKKKKKATEIVYRNYIGVDFARETQQWQDSLYEKHKALDASMKRYAENAILCNEILPAKYFVFNYEYYGKHPVVAITQYIEDLRADTIKEAINLYETDEREARRDHENSVHRGQMEQYAAGQMRAARLAQAYAEQAADAAKRGADAAERTAVATKRGAAASERGAVAAEKQAEHLHEIKERARGNWGGIHTK